MRSLYANELMIRYMSGMRSAIDYERGVIFPNKLDQSNIRAFSADFYDPTASNISYLYVMEKRPEAKSVSKLPAEVSLITKEFVTNPRSQNYNMGYQVRRWSKPLTANIDGEKVSATLRTTEALPPLKDIFDFIKRWDNVSGKKYGARLASSYDKNFFTNHYDEVKDCVQALFFYLDYAGGSRLCGYSILELPTSERDGGYSVSRYGPRKVDITVGSNLCQFVDYESFRRLRSIVGEDIVLHWGWAEKGIREYERRNFPNYREDLYLQYAIHPVEVKARRLF